MGASLEDTFSQSRTRNDQNTNTTNQQTTNQDGTTTPTFNSPQSQGILNSLSGQNSAPLTYNSGLMGGGPNQDVTGASQTFGNAAETGSPIADYKQNPYISAILSSSDKLADQQMQKGEAGMRAQDYGQGDIKSLNDQGTFASTFANQQALQDAQTQLGQYNIAGSTAMQGAAGLGGLGQNQQGLAAQILALLRGSSTTGLTNTSGSGTNDTSGTLSTIGHSDTGKVSYGSTGGGGGGGGLF